jgi:hypothetical protein
LPRRRAPGRSEQPSQSSEGIPVPKGSRGPVRVRRRPPASGARSTPSPRTRTCARASSAS